METQQHIDAQSDAEDSGSISDQTPPIEPMLPRCHKGKSGKCLRGEGCSWDAFYKAVGEGMGGNTTCIQDNKP